MGEKNIINQSYFSLFFPILHYFLGFFVVVFLLLVVVVVCLF